MGGNNIDTLQPRLMVQNQYTNIGGVESVWNSHTVLGGAASTAAPRYYQVNVTGGTVSATTTQALTHAPDTTVNRSMSSLALDKSGDMLLGYTASSSTLLPALRWAGRLATDPVNTLPQTEVDAQTGTGTQSGNCGGAACTRWGDYSAMSLDPDGCTFWYTGEYYIATGLNWQNRIVATKYPTCTAFANNGILSGTVTSTLTGLPISGATIAFGSRTATTNGSGVYSFTNLPAGTYLAETASATGYNSSSAANLAVADGTTTTQNFALSTSVASACLTDTTQSDLQTGISTNVDLTTSAGDATLNNTSNLDQQNTSLGTSGVGINITTWSGQTFTPAVTGQLTKADINLFCSGCTGTTPNLTLSLRATSANVPTGGDLASATITGFSSGAAVYYTGTFASPPTLTAGTKYALVIRPTANPSLGTYAITRSGTSLVGTSTYAGGDRVTGATSGTVWTIPLSGSATPGVTDAGFRTFMQTGYSLSGDLTSATKDASPVTSNTTNWTMISWTATTPSNTSLKFQVAASNNVNGPFNFVGTDGTAATFFTVSGSSLSQFNGLRYLKYKAFFATTDTAASPTLNDVTVCYTNPRVWTGAVSSDWNNPANWTSSGIPGSSDRAIIPATGVVNNPTNTTSNTVGSLQLDSGIIDTGANTLTVTTCSPTAVTGGSATSYVKGNLTRCVDSAGVYNFPVGTTAGYSPVSLANVAGSGNFNVNPLDGALAGTNTAQSLTRNWGLTPAGGVTQADITFNYLQADVPSGANEAAFQFIRRSGTTNTAFAPTSINTTSNTATLNAVSSFSNWTLGINAPTAAGVSISGRVLNANGGGISNAIIVLQSNNGGANLSVRTNTFGYYRFENITVGGSYLMTVNSKRYTFQSRVISLSDDLADIDFIADSPNLRTESSKP
jgi:Carboxypeptidase regulatory-like domain